MRLTNNPELPGLFKITYKENSIVTANSCGFRVCFVCEGKLLFEPEDIYIDINKDEYDFLSSLSEGDVIEISEEGTVWKRFERKAGDNTLYITDKCNSNCIMCPMPEVARKNGMEVIPERLWDLVRYMPSDLQHVTITGGEPFLAKHVMFDILTFLKEKCTGTEFLLLSNGRAFSIEHYAEKLKDSAPARFCIGIPIHGHNEELHDLISQTKGSFEQTIKGAKALSGLGIDVEIRIVVSKLNAEHIIDIAKLIVTELPGVSSVKLMAMEMLGNAAVNFDKVWLPYEQFFSHVKEAVKVLVEHRIDVAIYNVPLCFVDEAYWYICKQSISDYKVRYFDKCDACKVKDACGGVFAGTHRFLEESIKPIV